MGKQHLSRDDRIFMDGKRRGTQENMDMVAMVPAASVLVWCT